MAKPWFQKELERITHERWQVKPSGAAVVIKCTHGMQITVLNSPGQDKPFLNEHAERQFVGKIMPAHRPFEEVIVRWPEFALS